MADRSRYSRRSDQFSPDQADELSLLSTQYFFERPSCLHRSHAAAHRAHLYLFPALHRAAQSSVDLCLCLPVDVNGGVHAVFHHLQPGHDGVLDSRDLHHRLHRLFFRIFSRRPNVSHRHHARWNPGGDEMVALLLRVVLSGRDFSWQVTGHCTRASTRNSNRLAFAHVGRGARHVETRSRPLPGRGWIAKFDLPPLESAGRSYLLFFLAAFFLAFLALFFLGPFMVFIVLEMPR